jgi:DNA adenine methylase
MGFSHPAPPAGGGITRPSNPMSDYKSPVEGHLPVRPVLPVAAYVGGKRNLARQLVALIAAIPHATYVEPFVGMGGVFLRRQYRAPGEIINDISSDVVTLFRILQRHYQALMDVLKWQIASRAEWERLMQVPPDTLTDLERAARFLYVQRLGFGGKVDGRTFGTHVRMPSRFDVTKLAGMLEDVHERLCGVTIERLHYADCITRYDRPDTLFFLDPPYYECEDYYGPGVFSRADFERLAHILGALKGRFIMTINDRPDVRHIFGAFDQQPVEVRYTLAADAARRASFGELIITGGNGH